MKITLVNHASVFLEEGRVGFLSDPWFFGEVFNDSWALEYKTNENVVKNVLKKLTHIYISHEHPDHFHFPTLKFIKENCNNQIKVIIQDLPRKEVLYAIKKIGFLEVLEVGSREQIMVDEGIFVYLYSVFPVDSACGFISRRKNKKNKVILNLNDTELCDYDLKTIKKDLKNVDVLLNQFSFATYNGDEDIQKQTTKVSNLIVKSFIYEQKIFKPRFSIPFASFSSFCNIDNKRLNKYRTDLKYLKSKIIEENLQCKILLPGQSINTISPVISNDIIFRDNLVNKKQNILIEKRPVSSFEIMHSFKKCYQLLSRRFTRLLIFPLGKFIVLCPDSNNKFLLNFVNGSIREIGSSQKEDLIIPSDALFYAFSYSWGMNTLTIGGRLIVKSKRKRFMLLRILLTLSNSNVSLKFNRESLITIKYFARNLKRIAYQAWSLMVKITFSEI